MLGQQFYHETIRKVVVAFGTMFNNIQLVRKDNSGNIIQTMKVPLAYGPRDKYLTRLDDDADLTKSVAVTLPRIGFEINNLTYDPTRKLNRVQKFKKVKGDKNDQLDTQYMPVPYNLEFTLYIMAKQSEDALQVVEQILPYFQPDYTITINDMTDMGIKKDVPIVLNSISYEDDYQADFQTRRAIIYSFNFLVKGYLFGPVSNKGTIKKTVVDFNVAEGDTLVDTSKGPNKRVTLTPGLLANGSPTSNSTASVASSSISANSNYGFAFDSEDFFDGKSR